MMDSIKVTIIATKFDDSRLKLFRFKKNEEIEKEPSFSKAVEGKEVNQESEIESEDEFIDDDSSEFDIPAFLRKK